jgi:hypothetical protein
MVTDCIIGGIGLPSFYRATVNCPGYSLKVYLRVPREGYFAARSEWYRHILCYTGGIKTQAGRFQCCVTYPGLGSLVCRPARGILGGSKKDKGG